MLRLYSQCTAYLALAYSTARTVRVEWELRGQFADGPVRRTVAFRQGSVHFCQAEAHEVLIAPGGVVRLLCVARQRPSLSDVRHAKCCTAASGAAMG